MRVFLTGGSGYVGASVVPALLRGGHDVTALARSESSAAALAALGATPVRGDLTDAEVLSGAAAQADGAIHLGAISSGDAAAVDLAAARAMQTGLDGRGAYVHTGGVWVYGDTDGVVDEDAPKAPPPITAWRVANEEAVLADADRGGRPVLVMPGLVYGNGGHLIKAFFTDPGRAAGAVPQIGDGSGHWSLIHVEDLAELYVKALDAAPGSVYAAVSDQNVRIADISQALSVAIGRPGSIETITLEQAIERMGPIAEAFALDQQLTGARARRELKWAPRYLDALAELETAGG
ncbi:NAD-dependent epimerase/dehydratase family protein [Streptomyces sp. NBC_01198]|uniref:NAD-dependent epimerase/dehydratase family protein n=1 Tax=Streptomyces sp. NBC_01198 TaxID=2903769 RepID=UPI002E140E7B|nr:NAD-dependent epimerase/dehydratase family protein [Streptomyces sp. NBC_01198]